MICCVVLLLLAGGARAVVLTLLPGRSRHERTPFPPAAQRSVGDDGAPVPLRARPATPARHGAVHAPHRMTGTALVVFGTGWFVAGIISMHVLGIVPASIGASTWRDVVFHLSGPLVGSAGLVLRSPVRVERRARVRPAVATGASRP